MDSAFSMEPAEMRQLVMETERAWQALGHVAYGLPEREKGSLQYRRSLYVVWDMKAGDVLTRENLRAIRPGFGLAPKYLENILGKAVKRDIAKGTPVSWNLV